VALYLLYFRGLADVGVLLVDEPRYAAIGRTMAQTGDWVTPRLWGEPWFEKPALLYWLIASGHRLGLPGEWAPRLPVAVISVAFLGYYWFSLRRQFGSEPAWMAPAMLATSVGWISYSHVAVPDIPLSAALGGAILAWLAGQAALAGVLLGLAILAKGLVPLALIAPILVIGWRDWKRGAVLLATAALVAVPWYWICYQRNGGEFFNEFFLRHHLARFAGDEDLHWQPFWFYPPVLLAGVFPWTPMLILLFRRAHWRDMARRPFLVWLTAGLCILTLPAGKLPGYLLPLLPPLFALIAVELQSTSIRMRAVLAGVSLWLGLVLIPAAMEMLPTALQYGLSRSQWRPGSQLLLEATVVAAAVAILTYRAAGQLAALRWPMAALAALLSLMHPVAAQKMEAVASARHLWRSDLVWREHEVCVESVHRSWRYGLNYYSEKPLPDCSEQFRPWRLVPNERTGRPALELNRPVPVNPARAP
jgi:4-amino-4-deoxy-L-arabinose transferase-like glycosyltransferase